MKNKTKDENVKEQKLKLSTALFKGSFIYNPILTQAIGICPIVSAATTLKNAAVLSFVLFVSLVLCETAASFAFKRIERNIRICLYCLIASVPTLLSMTVISDKTLSSLGVFLPLLSVNAIIVIRCEKFAVKTNVRNSFFDAIASSLGFAVVAAAVGFFRELFSFGTVFSVKVSSFPVFSAFALPFGGLVILGFLAAVHKAIVMNKFENELTDTFNFSKVFEKPALRDPGLGIGKKESKQIDETAHDFSKIRSRYSFNEPEKDNKEGNE